MNNTCTYNSCPQTLQLQVTDRGSPHLSSVVNFFIKVNNSLPKPPPQTTLFKRTSHEITLGLHSVIL